MQRIPPGGRPPDRTERQNRDMAAECKTVLLPRSEDPEPILAAAESSFRSGSLSRGLIGQDVALSAIAAALHVHRCATRGDNRTHTEYGHQRHTGGAL